jgi:hypothetical protein
VNVILFSAKKMMLIIGLLSIVILCGLALLKHDKYIRYQMLDVGTYKAASWIYERIHFDKTPIDIAFFGTSHTMNAIDSVIVESSLNEKSQNKRRVVNFAIPHFGRDMHHTLVKLLLAERKPEVIILEVREQEARDLHPGTHYLADIEDVFTAPLIVNFRYLGNLIRQPLRQVSALSYEYFAGFFGRSFAFDQENYVGKHLNHALIWPDGKKREGVVDKQQIDNVKIQTSPEKHNEFNIASIRNFLEHNANLYYINEISALAVKNKVELVFLYLPSYGMAEQPANEGLYLTHGKIIKPALTTLRNKSLWSDLGHLNASGAEQVSNEIAALLIKERH